MTVAATGLPPLGVNVKLIVLAWTAWLNVAVAVDDTATLVAPDAGVSLVTMRRWSGRSVVNDQRTGRSWDRPRCPWHR